MVYVYDSQWKMAVKIRDLLIYFSINIIKISSLQYLILLDCDQIILYSVLNGRYLFIFQENFLCK